MKIIKSKKDRWTTYKSKVDSYNGKWIQKKKKNFLKKYLMPKYNYLTKFYQEMFQKYYNNIITVILY